jgi:glutathione S-transferase
MKLYNAWYCPFAQRAWMALVYKGIDHPAFKTTAFEQGDYEQRLVEHYYPYSLGEGQTDVTRV